MEHETEFASRQASLARDALADRSSAANRKRILAATLTLAT
jgi:hypothetical protein